MVYSRGWSYRARTVPVLTVQALLSRSSTIVEFIFNGFSLIKILLNKKILNIYLMGVDERDISDCNQFDHEMSRNFSSRKVSCSLKFDMYYPGICFYIEKVAKLG